MIRRSNLAAFAAAVIALSAVAMPSRPARAGALPGAQEPESRAAVEKKAAPGPWIGIYFEPIPVLAGKKLSYPHETGIIITKVVATSPADKAGLRDEDIVYRFGGAIVEDQEHFLELLRAKRPGDRVTVAIYRKGVERKLELVLGSQRDRKETPPVIGRTEEALKAQEEAMKALSDHFQRLYLTRGRIGLRLRDLNDDLASYFGVDRNTGVLVLDVDAESSAERAGVKPGDVIVAVNGAPVTQSTDVAAAVGGLEPGEKVSIEIIRKGAKRTFEVEVEKPVSGDYRSFIIPLEEGAPVIPDLGGPDQDRKIEEELRRLRTEERSKKIQAEIDSLQSRIRDLEKLQRERREEREKR